MTNQINRNFPPLLIGAIMVDSDPVTGITMRCLDGRFQIVTMECEHGCPFDGEMHINECAQWVIVLSGEAVVWLGEKAELHVLRRGDTILIPAGMPHGVELKPGYRDLTVYEGSRYSTEGGGKSANTQISAR